MIDKDRLPIRETYLFEDDEHFWIEEYQATWPTGQTVTVNVPVPNPPADVKERVERELKNTTSNLILRWGKSRNAKGRPKVVTTRKLIALASLPEDSRY